MPYDPYRQLVFPMLRRFDAERVHDVAIAGLERAGALGVGRGVLRMWAGGIPYQPVEVCGVTFPSCLGVAAGFDKDVRVARGLGALGFGHVEVGTLTPRPQAGNPRPRVFRLLEDRAVINRMGFPNGGVEAAVPRLRQLALVRGAMRVGVSLGKQKETPLEAAAGDYLAVMRRVHGCADYLAVNISSPNTPGLRELQGGNFLGALCRTLQAENRRLSARRPGPRPPLFVKIAPDLTRGELDEVLAAALDAGIDGIIATNTTLARGGIRSAARAETGGLSGAPLRQRATAMVSYIARHAGSRLAIIAVGGVETADHVREKLDAGASLVQVYTGFIYRGPRMAGEILRGLIP